jgi:hypothetical protein
LRHLTSHVNHSAELADITVGDPDGRVTGGGLPVTATPAVLAGVAICYAMLNAFEAGRNCGELRPV